MLFCLHVAGDFSLDLSSAHTHICLETPSFGLSVGTCFPRLGDLRVLPLRRRRHHRRGRPEGWLWSTRVARPLGDPLPPMPPPRRASFCLVRCAITTIASLPPPPAEPRRLGAGPGTNSATSRDEMCRGNRPNSRQECVRDTAEELHNKLGMRARTRSRPRHRHDPHIFAPRVRFGVEEPFLAGRLTRASQCHLHSACDGAASGGPQATGWFLGCRFMQRAPQRQRQPCRLTPIYWQKPFVPCRRGSYELGPPTKHTLEKVGQEARH